jgi:hypothetical protein
MDCSQRGLKRLIYTQEELNEELLLKIEELNNKIKNYSSMDSSPEKRKLLKKVIKEYYSIVKLTKTLQGNLKLVQSCEKNFTGLTKFSELKKTKIQSGINLKEHCSIDGDGCETEFCKNFPMSKCPIDYKMLIIYIGTVIFFVMFVFLTIRLFKR